MLKPLRIVLAIIVANTICYNASSQSLGVNTTGAPAANSAILDVSSTDKGMLIPRMSKAQKNAIASPANGLLVYQDSPDSIGFQYFDGTRWNWLANSGKIDSTAWLTTGNTALNDTSFIGTRDDKALNFRVNNIKAGRFDRVRANYFIGRNAGHDNGVGHVAMGDSAGTNVSNNYPGIYLGFRSGVYNTGTNNSFVGSWSGEKNTTGSGNAFFGTASGINNTTGGSNTYLGHFSAYNASGGGANVAVGTFAMYGITNGSNNIAIGYNALSDYQGSNVTAVGYFALDSLTTGTRATAIGYRTLTQNTSGDRNTAVGYRSLDSNKTGSYNVGLGYAALFRNQSNFNTAVGDNTLNNAADPTAESNTIIGAESMIQNTSGRWNASLGVNNFFQNTTGSYNTASGFQSMMLNTSGSYNTASGLWSAYNNTTGHYNVAIGFQALATNDSGSNNVAVGVNSLYSHRRPGSSYNTSIGNYSLEQDTSGYANTGCGVSTLRNNINGQGLTGLGANAMYNHKYGDYNTAVGYESMFFDTSSYMNTAIGWRSLRYNLRGDQNTAIGVGAIEFTDSAFANVAVGRGAMIGSYQNTTNLAYNTIMGFYAGALMDSVSYVTAIGMQAGYNNRGIQNTFVGANAGLGATPGVNLTGIENTGIGASSLTYTTTGKANTALGLGALYFNTTGNGNVAVGTRALANPSTYSYNIAIGDSALYITSASENMAIGTFAMRVNNTGTQNSAIGNYALQFTSTGNYNTALGHQSLQNTNANGNTALGYQAGLTNTSGTYNSFIGYNADASSTTLTNATAIGTNALVGQSNSLVLGSISGLNGALATATVGVGVSTPSARLHVRRNGASGGSFLANASMIIEDNTSSYVQLSNPTNNENGILSGSAATTIRSGIVFGIDSSLMLRAGGNSNRMFIDNNGYVGVGTTAPLSRFHVYDGTAVNPSIRIASVSTSYEPGLELVKTGGGSDWKIRVDVGGILTYSWAGDDFVGTPTDYYEMATASFRPSTDILNSLGLSTRRWTTVYAQNGTINTSDARDKENITDLNYGLNEVMKLRPVSFNWKDNPQWGKKIGFIAQEVQPVLKEVVQVGELKTKDTKTAADDQGKVAKESDKLGIYYSDIIPVTVKAIQEQQVLIEKQAKENAELKAKNEQLEKDIQLIKEKLGIKN